MHNDCWSSSPHMLPEIGINDKIYNRCHNPSIGEASNRSKTEIKHYYCNILCFCWDDRMLIMCAPYPDRYWFCHIRTSDIQEVPKGI